MSAARKLSLGEGDRASRGPQSAVKTGVVEVGEKNARALTPAQRASSLAELRVVSAQFEGNVAAVLKLGGEGGELDGI